MVRFKTIAAPVRRGVAVLCVGMLPLLSHAADDDIASLRAELQALKNDYAQRVSALEAHIAQLESGPVAAPTVMPPSAQEAARAASAFNPAISVILGGGYTDTSRDPHDWHIGGTLPGAGEVGPGERSFNLGESEITLSANVDPWFYANLTAALTPENEVEIEEAFFRTTSLPDGFTLKGGRFFSGFGYLNEVHAHAWDFADQPLVYQAFFGGQYRQNGLQLKWIAPADTFVELGAEAGNGEDFPGTRLSRNGMNGATFFAHVGGDIGNSTSWRAGASWVDLKAEDRGYEDTDAFGMPVTNAFTGKSQTWMADAVLKWAPNGNATRQQLKLQGEYMRRKEDGQLAFDTAGLNLSDAFSSEQSGWYVQSVFQFMPRWRVGLRYDSLDTGNTSIALVSTGLLSPDAFPALRGIDPDRVSLMLDWNPSEFTRIRAQYDRDDARAAGAIDRIFRLQYLYGIGAHGAHKY
jgi:hypothetical protein